MMNSGGFYPPNGPSTFPMKTDAYNEFGSGAGGGGVVGGGSYMNNRAIQHVPETSESFVNNGSGGGGYYSEEVYPSYYEYPQYAPCDGGPGPWNYNYCYGFFGEPPCPYANVIDMEDFM